MNSVRFRSILPFIVTAALPVLIACGGGASEPTPTITPIPFVPIAQETPTPLPEVFTTGRFTPVANPTPVPTPEPEKEIEQFEGAPPITIDLEKTYKATIELGTSFTSKGGTFVIELYPKEAPNAVNNFVFLARKGFYDGLPFHRVIKGEYGVGGAPSGELTGGPGYEFGDEFSATLRHDKPGTVSMASRGPGDSGKGTNGSQFFISFKPRPDLDGLNSDGSAKNCGSTGTEYRADQSCHTVFGQIVEGLERALALTPWTHEKGSRQPPQEFIEKMTITEE
jgi:peptidyl-prolyl cis-trans isomerase B (cyclophilin B)